MPPKISREDWERARTTCGSAPSRETCSAVTTSPSLTCKWTNVEKVVTEEDIQLTDRPAYGCRPWNAFDTRIDRRFKDDPAQLAGFTTPLAWGFYVLAAILVLVIPIIAKGALDLYPAIAILWFAVGVAVIARVRTYEGFIVGLVVFLVIDGVVDSFMTGGFQWIHPPWILETVHWLTPIGGGFYLGQLYLIALWTGGFLARAYLASTKVTLNWFKGLGITVGSYIISASGVSDYINLGIRPKVPDFDTYFRPLGFWTWERFTIRTIIHIAIGIAVIYLAWHNPKKSVLALGGFFAIAAVLSTYPIILDIFI